MSDTHNTDNAVPTAIVAEGTGSLRRRQDKPTVRIERRTLAECAARAAAFYACQDLGLPSPDLNR